MEAGRPSYVPKEVSIAAYRIAWLRLKELEGTEEGKGLEAYLKSFQRKTNGTRKSLSIAEDGSKYMPLPYIVLSDFAKMTRTSLLDIYREAYGTDPEWPTEDGAELHQILQGKSECYLEWFRDLIDFMSPDFWKPGSVEHKRGELDFPVARFNYLVKHQPEWCRHQKDFFQRMSKPDCLIEWDKRNRDSTIYVMPEYLWEECKLLEVSPAWVLGWAYGNASFMASTPELEYLMAGYYFLSKTNRRVILDIVHTD